MSKFKVGDRVIGNGIEDGKNVSGKTGTIAWCGDTGKFYWVRFDENVDGWSDDACGIPAGHGWTVEGSKLKLVEGAQPIQSSRKTLPLSSIHITRAFSDHLPDPKKITKCYEFYKANGEFNKDIVINMRNVLVDGYVAYLIAKMVGMKNVPVLQTNSDTLDKPKKAKEEAKPAKAAPKFKVGDKVKVIGNGHTIPHFILLNTIADVSEVYSYKVEVIGKSKTDGTFIHQSVSLADVEPYSEPAPASTEPDKQEAVKLYCVKDRPWGFNLTKGKTYTFDSVSGITDDDGFIARNYESYSAFTKANPDIAKHLVLLVKRPAKVGEWVLITGGSENNAWNALHEIYNGIIYKVVGFGFSPIIKTADETDYGWSILDGVEYLVLDGYQPEPEKPKYYSGKVVCVEGTGHTCFFTVGKIYEFIDGLVKGDDGDYYNSGNPARTKEEALTRKTVQFIELKQ